MNRSYLELLTFSTFDERLKYLSLFGKVCDETFGHDRYLNQVLYKSQEWRKIRDSIIIRDNGCDLGMAGFEIVHGIIVHHINPITLNDIYERNPVIFDPNNLICVSHSTHNMLHYGQNDLKRISEDRKPGDTKLW